MVKRLLDLLLIVIFAPIWLPVLLFLFIVVRCRIGSPVFFRQLRPGYLGDPFYLVKFRTMTNAIDSNGGPLPDEQRLTKSGKWLRSTSLDELPEVLNVLKGEMSLVGPRPLLMQYLPLYSARQARRHEVKPGITGWAQISGRNAISWEEKFEMDLWYVENQSLFLDLKILALTVGKVFSRDGINAPNGVTPPFFTGEGIHREK
jgi:sugar transferase EpsL